MIQTEIWLRLVIYKSIPEAVGLSGLKYLLRKGKIFHVSKFNSHHYQNTILNQISFKTGTAAI